MGQIISSIIICMTEIYLSEIYLSITAITTITQLRNKSIGNEITIFVPSEIFYMIGMKIALFCLYEIIAL